MASSTKIKIPRINTLNEARSSGELTTASSNSVNKSIKELIAIANSIKANQITGTKESAAKLTSIDKNIDKSIRENKKAYGNFVTISSSTTTEDTNTSSDYDYGNRSKTTTRTRVSSFTDSDRSNSSGHTSSSYMPNKGIMDGIKGFGDRASSGFAPSLALSVATGGALNPVLIQALWGPMKQFAGLIKDTILLPFRAISAIWGSMKNVFGFITSPFHSFGHGGGSNSEYGLQGETKATTNARDNQLYRRLDTIISLLGKKPALEKEEKKEKSGGFLSSLFGFLGEVIKIGGLIALGYGVFKVIGMDKIKEGWEAIKESKQKDGWWGAIKTTLSTVVDWGKIIGGFIYDWYEESGLKNTISGFIEGVKQDIKDWWDKDKEREKDPNQFSIHRVFTWINKKISGILGEGWSEVWNNTLLSLSSGWNILTDDKASDKYFENIQKYWNNETKDWKENTPDKIKNYDKIFDLMDEKGLTGSQLKLSFAKFKKNISDKVANMYANSTDWLGNAFAPMFGDNSPESEAFKKFQLMDFEKGQTGNLDNYGWSDKAFYNIYKTTNDFMNSEEEGAFSLPNIKKTFSGFLSFSISSLIETGVNIVKEKWNNFQGKLALQYKQYSDWKNDPEGFFAKNEHYSINGEELNFEDNQFYKMNKAFSKIIESFTEMFKGKEGEEGFFDKIVNSITNFFTNDEGKSIISEFQDKLIEIVTNQIPIVIKAVIGWVETKLSDDNLLSSAVKSSLNTFYGKLFSTQVKQTKENIQQGNVTKETKEQTEKILNDNIGWINMANNASGTFSNLIKNGKYWLNNKLELLAALGIGAANIPYKLGGGNKVPQEYTKLPSGSFFEYTDDIDTPNVGYIDENGNLKVYNKITNPTQFEAILNIKHNKELFEAQHKLLAARDMIEIENATSLIAYKEELRDYINNKKGGDLNYDTLLQVCTLLEKMLKDNRVDAEEAKKATEETTKAIKELGPVKQSVPVFIPAKNTISGDGN